MIDRVRAALEPEVDDLVLAANDPDADGWLAGVRVARDRLPGAGGLAGLHAVISADTDVLVVAWDMPFVTRELLAGLRDLARTERAEVCVPESDAPFGIEPFCAFYSGVVAGRLDAYLARGGGPARDFLTRCAVRRMTAAEVRVFGDPAVLFLNVNTARDLERARAIATR